MNRLILTITILVLSLVDVFSQNKKVTVLMKDGTEMTGEIIGEPIKFIVYRPADTLNLAIEDVANITSKDDKVDTENYDLKPTKKNRSINTSLGIGVATNNMYFLGFGLHFRSLDPRLERLRMGLRMDLVTDEGEYYFARTLGNIKFDGRYKIVSPRKWIDYEIVGGMGLFGDVLNEGTLRFSNSLYEFSNGFNANLGLSFRFNFTKNSAASIDVGIMRIKHTYASTDSNFPNFVDAKNSLYTQFIIFL